MNLESATLSNPAPSYSAGGVSTVVRSVLHYGGTITVTNSNITIQEAKGFASNPTGGKVEPFLTNPVSGTDALALFPVLGTDTTYYVYVEVAGTADVPTFTIVSSTTDPSIVPLASQLSLASVLVPANVTDPASWTIDQSTTFRRFEHFGYGIGGHTPADPGAHPNGELGCFLGYTYDGVDFRPAASSSTTLANTAGLSVAVLAGYLYTFRFHFLFQSANVGAGLKLGLTFPVGVCAATIRIPIAADGTDSEVVGQITSSGDSVIGTGVEVINTTYLATVVGVIQPSAAGTLQVQHARGGGSASAIAPMAGSNGRIVLESYPYTSLL